MNYKQWSDAKKQELINTVIAQIKSDIDSGEYDAVTELLNSVTRENLIAYLPESDE